MFDTLKTSVCTQTGVAGVCFACDFPGLPSGLSQMLSTCRVQPPCPGSGGPSGCSELGAEVGLRDPFLSFETPLPNMCEVLLRWKVWFLKTVINEGWCFPARKLVWRCNCI